MTDPDQILANYEGTLAEAQRRSDAIRETLAALQVTERSADGQISVTVNDAGNLVDLKLGNALQRKDGDTVGREVLRVVQAAQGRVAATVQEAMAPLMGADSEAMHMMMDKLRSAQPPAEPER
ncbi:MAG TPA: YbaB/EbfC family nucleoid-associated protein, partial [Lentzea sp.]